MGFCSSCNNRVIASHCHCGAGFFWPHPKSTPSTCPSAPPIAPCGTRIIDGAEQPYWHRLHPLIPKFRETISLDVTDEKLKVELTMAANYCSTCQFQSKIYDAICLRAAAQIELQQETSLWQSQRAASIGYGSRAAIERPSIYSGYYGSLLKDLIDSHPVAVGVYV